VTLTHDPQSTEPRDPSLLTVNKLDLDPLTFPLVLEDGKWLLPEELVTDLAKRDTSRKECGARMKFASPTRNLTREEDPSTPPSVPKDTLSRTENAGRIAERDTLVNGIIGIDAKRIVRLERLARREFVTRNDVPPDIIRPPENVTRMLALEDMLRKVRLSVGDLAPNLTLLKDRNV
jgi:hypothetical protein